MTKLRSFGRAHPAVVVIAIVVVVAGGAAAWAAASVLRVEPSYVYFGVPSAPQLTASGESQTVYRIDAGRSTITYEVDENLAGITNTARGSTQGIAGDILLDEADPSASEVGEMVVNVQQLTSDQELRDNRLRHDYLQSDDYPLASFTTTSIDGLPDTIADGTDYELTLEGELTVKETTAPATLEATARRSGDELQITARTEVKLSTFDVGPISLIGFVSSGDDAVLLFDLVAVDADTIEDPVQLARQEAPEVNTPATAGGGGPSFAATVQPILEQDCASCHIPGEAGAPVWELDTAADAAEVAGGLKLVTGSGFMPPWLASDKSVEFHDPMVLADDQIAAIADWADAGAPLDVAADTPIRPPADQEVAHPRPDLELASAEPYEGDPDNVNDYRCFVLETGLDGPAVIRGYEFVPDQTEYVHHALVYRVSADQLDGVKERDAADPGEGYECYGGVGARENLSPDGSGGGVDRIMGWAPGQQPAAYPDGAGMHLAEGDFFVMQIHYHFVHAAPPDQSTLVMELADGPPEDYDDIVVTTYLAPAEIPCTPDEAARPDAQLCDRDAVIELLAEQYGPSGPSIANGLHLLCGTTVEEIAVLDDTRAGVSCEHRVRNTGKILGVLGHMHEIGDAYRMTLNPGTPEETILLDIPNWDFGWQLNYSPVDDIVLERGDVIKVECTWDRDRLDPADPPRWVTWAEGTEDEMCFSTVATLDTGDDG